MFLMASMLVIIKAITLTVIVAVLCIQPILGCVPITEAKLQCRSKCHINQRMVCRTNDKIIK